MGNTFFLFLFILVFITVLSFWFAWQVNQSLIVSVKLGQFNRAEVNIPDSIRDLSQANQFSGQCSCEVDVPPFPLQVALMMNSSQHHVVGVDHLGHNQRIESR